MNKLQNRVSKISTSQLIEIAKNLSEKIDRYSNLVFEVVIDEVENRLPEAKFILLLGEIEEAI